MKVHTELVVIEAGGSIESEAEATIDHKLATKGFFPPQLVTTSLPAAAGVEGVLFYDLTLKKLVVSNGSAYETVTSAA